MTSEKLEIYGHAESGKHYYELKDYIDAEGKCYTVLEWTNLKNGDTKQFDWGKMHKRGLTSLFFFYILKAVKRLRNALNKFHFYKNNFTKEVNRSDHPRNQDAV